MTIEQNYYKHLRCVDCFKKIVNKQKYIYSVFVYSNNLYAGQYQFGISLFLFQEAILRFSSDI